MIATLCWLELYEDFSSTRKVGTGSQLLHPGKGSTNNYKTGKCGKIIFSNLIK